MKIYFHKIRCPARFTFESADSSKQTSILQFIKRKLAIYKLTKKETVKQHYVPQFYLREFCKPDGRLYAFNPENRKCINTIPKEICYKKYLYETEFENNTLGMKFVNPNDIENVFCKYEGEYAAFIKLIKSVCTPKQNPHALILRHEEKRIMLSFIVNLLFRNPAAIQDMSLFTLPDGVVESDYYNTIEYMTKKMQIGDAKSLFLAAQKMVFLTEEVPGSTPERFIRELNDFPFVFLYANGSEFITSDVPICFGEDLLIKSENQDCLYFPITPKTAVILGNYRISKVFCNRMLPIEETAVKKINKQYFKNRNYIQWVISSSQEALRTASKE